MLIGVESDLCPPAQQPDKHRKAVSQRAGMVGLESQEFFVHMKQFISYSKPGRGFKIPCVISFLGYASPSHMQLEIDKTLF